MRLRPLAAFLLAIFWCSPLWAYHPEDARELRGGWYHWDPYQFEENNQDIPHLTGLDVQLIRTVLERAGYQIELEKVPWDTHLREVAEGSRDIAFGASRTAERLKYARFSDPYRTETDVLILPRGQAAQYHFNTVAEMLDTFRRERFRLGVVRGFYYGPEVDAFLKDPANEPFIHYATSDTINLTRLTHGDIDGYLADRLAAATCAWRAGLLDATEEYPLTVYSADIHAIFSRKTCSPEIVEAFNQALAKIKSSGEYNRISRHYGIPVLLGITIHQPWFFLLEMAGTIAFAVSGVLIARRERYDIFGAFVLASLPAVGGGVLRDLLSGRNPIGILRSPIYLYAILATVCLGLAIYKISDFIRTRRSGQPAGSSHGTGWSGNVYQFFDAVGLAAFTITGAVIAVERQCEPLWLWGPLLAAATGAGGGIIRDVVRADSNNPSLKGSFYPEIAVIWGFAFSMFLAWESSRLNLTEVSWAVALTVAGALITRLLVIRYKIQSIFF